MHPNPNCRGVAPLRFPERFSEWSRWINKQGSVDGDGALCSWCQKLTYVDVDGIWLQDRHRRDVLLQGIEVKSHGEQFLSGGQLMVLNTLEAALTAMHGQSILIENLWGRQGWNGHRNFWWFGVHTLEMDGDSPDDSRHLIWDQEHEITVDELVRIMRFEHDPRSPGEDLILPSEVLS